MPGQTRAVLGHIALAGDDGMPMRDLEKATGRPQSTISRLILFLMKEYKGEPGPDLVEHIIDPADYRAKIVRLTPKGKRLMAQLEKTLT